MSNEKMRAEAFAACPDGIDWGAFWLGYKASRAALCVELPKNDLSMQGENRWRARQSGINACRSAIESTGVKTK